MKIGHFRTVIQNIKWDVFETQYTSLLSG